MKYSSGKEFLDDPTKCVLIMGLSGVGKTTACKMLPDDEWFHYSVDYRLWTHHLGDQLNDYLKRLAFKQPQLRQLLMKDAISVEHRVHFDNLFATSVYMGMLGNPDEGGSSEVEFKERMKEYASAEIRSMLDIPKFMKRSKDLYGYPHFLVDASGSLCEIVELNDDDPVLKLLEEKCLVIYIEATKEHEKELIRRAAMDPKPIYYRPDFIEDQKEATLKVYNAKKFAEISPADVGRQLYPRLLEHRIPRYGKIVDKFGYKISMTDLLKASSSEDLLNLIAKTIDTAVKN